VLKRRANYRTVPAAVEIPPGHRIVRRGRQGLQLVQGALEVAGDDDDQLAHRSSAHRAPGMDGAVRHVEKGAGAGNTLLLPDEKPRVPL
jgi:hypothetical protein